MVQCLAACGMISRVQLFCTQFSNIHALLWYTFVYFTLFFGCVEKYRNCLAKPKSPDLVRIFQVFLWNLKKTYNQMIVSDNLFCLKQFFPAGKKNITWKLRFANVILFILSTKMCKRHDIYISTQEIIASELISWGTSSASLSYHTSNIPLISFQVNMTIIWCGMAFTRPCELNR